MNSVVPQATRSDTPYGNSTHVERINPDMPQTDPMEAQFRQHALDMANDLYRDGKIAKDEIEAHFRHYLDILRGAPQPAGAQSDPAPTEFAADGHPLGAHWPYRTTATSIIANMRMAAGALVWLLPHEVGRHHVLAKDVLAAQAAPAEAAPVEDHQNEQPPEPSAPPAGVPEGEGVPKYPEADEGHQTASADAGEVHPA